jgi:hypothetical protein
MRLFRDEKANETPGDKQRRDGGTDGIPSSQQNAAETAAAAAATAPAAWYPDPTNPGSFRYWDGAAWTDQTRQIPLAPSIPASETPSVTVAEATPSASPADTPSHLPDTGVETTGTVGVAQVESEKDIDTWVGEIEKAVSRARTVDTPAAWQIAARAAVVVSDIAQTMLVATHAHQIAEQATRTAEAAARQAQAAAQAADDAKRTSEQTARAAEVAGRRAREASLAAADAKRTAEQTAQAAPKALESAQAAKQAAADAKSTADRLDQMIVRAREANTPQAWSDAMQVAAEGRSAIEPPVS